MSEHPTGAISEDERYRFQGEVRVGKKGFYCVMSGGTLLIGGSSKEGGGIHQFSFSWDPSQAYYFTNYFLAFAYSLKVRERMRKK